MSRLYEGMFLIDNDTVRAGWAQAKAGLLEVLKKHGAVIETARRWDERRLAYTIKKRKRATFVLAYVSMEPEALKLLVRDLDISASVLRYLILKAEAVPDEERKLAEAEDATDFVVPEPPDEDAVDEPEPAEESEPRGRRSDGEGGDEKADGKADGKDETSEKEEAPVAAAAAESTEEAKQ